ncbi:hypothetical protein L7F22_057278 [Adiantum nelumboides]|nr:hypothetical protein [Adiantum nelumboides]
MNEDLLAAGSQASLIQHAIFVAKPVKTKTKETSSRATRLSKKSSSDDEQTNTDKEKDSQGSDKEVSQKGAEAKGPSEFEKSDEEDTSTPLDRKSKKPRSQQQVLLVEAQARVEERKKMLAEARTAKAATKKSKPQTMEEARLARLEKAKALLEERRRIKSKQKAQEVDLTSQSLEEHREKETVDITSHVEHLKKIQREKHLEEQRAAALAQEKIKESMKRTAEPAALEPQEARSAHKYKNMDWQGQQLTEQIMQYALLSAALVAFLAGYLTGSFQLMIQVYGALVVVVLLVVVPDWGCFNRHPMQWLDPKVAAESSSKSKPQVAATKKPTKAAKK